MLQSLATQEDSFAFKDALEQVASNLAFHVASAADKAHGIEAIHGYIDGSSIDRRCYRDSYGAYISGSDPTAANFIRFIISGVAYYAPAIYPVVDPGAQPASSAVPVSAFLGINGLYDTAFITSYSSASTVTEQSLSDALIQHTRTTHESAHIQLQAIVKTFYSPSGAVLADHAIRLVWNGTIYEIPCTTTLGGPAQLAATMLPLGLVATPGDGGTQDPPDVNAQFTGIPSHNYTVTMKVRGVVIVKPYNNAAWALPGQLVTCNPVPPAATAPQACFHFTGVLSPAGQAKPGVTIEWKLLIGNPALPTAIYCLNTGTTVSWPTALDYTFDFPLTTDSAGHATLTLTSRTGDHVTAGNIGRYRVDDAAPPLLSSIQAVQATKYVWMQVDVMSAV